MKILWSTDLMRFSVDRMKRAIRQTRLNLCESR
jgi:hypothetical protein